MKKWKINGPRGSIIGVIFGELGDYAIKNPIFMVESCKLKLLRFISCKKKEKKKLECRVTFGQNSRQI